ncbi:3196_t:CDS:2, partial [Dentiscutata erythropus]
MQLQYDNVMFSEIAGFVSIACWMVVGFPQLHENYKRKSGDSVAPSFIIIWLIGDLFNLIGAILQNLILTVVLIALYHNAIDFAIILQIFYYRLRKNRNPDWDEEVTPLQPQPARNESRTSVYRSRVREFLEILAGLVGVCVGGVIMYYISTLFRDDEESEKDDQLELELLPQIFGWGSALLYLSARIPQIIRNHKSQSTEGLSLAMFCFSVLGNVTFCSSIILYSTKYKYLLVNLPWLIGNGATLLFDFS